MTRREFVAALEGLDRARWPVQPTAAEDAMFRFYKQYTALGHDTKPCVWVDSPDEVRRRDPGRRISVISVPHSVHEMNKFSWPGGRDRFPNWFRNDDEVFEYLGVQSHLRTAQINNLEAARDAMHDAYVAGALAVYEFKETRYIVSRPMMHTDEEGRLHHERRPAASWFGGPYLYYIHGVGVEPWLVDGSRKVTIEDIHDLDNMEVRRVVIERFGWKKFLKGIGAYVVDEDPVHGVLWEANAPPGDNDWRRTMRLLELKDPSTNRKYFIRVPPTRGSAISARAWTFNKTVTEFKQLVKET